MTFAPPSPGPVWLASRSPRRRMLLREAGITPEVRPSDVDDGDVVRGAVTPAQWVMALAYLKARCVADALIAERSDRRGSVLAADTLCALGDRLLGQPADAAAAGAMIRALREGSHETITGVCVISLDDRRRWLCVDRAVVTIGVMDDETIDRYVRSGEWRGKAGAYNLQDRIDAGWPITCDGDPTTVMGLPMRRLAPWLSRLRREAS